MTSQVKIEIIFEDDLYKDLNLGIRITIVESNTQSLSFMMIE